MRFAVFIFVGLLLSFMFFVGSFFLYPFLATFFLTVFFLAAGLPKGFIFLSLHGFSLEQQLSFGPASVRTSKRFS